MPTRELLSTSFELSNPRNRLTSMEARKWSPGLAVGELAWHIRGDVSIDPLAFYAPRWRTFADASGNVRGSCYGARIFLPDESGRSNWTKAGDLLRKDIHSRRAVLSFRGDEDISSSTNDLSCVNTLQFIVRQGKLHAFVNMRSNDVIWGVPYDVFLFTTLQELMATELGLEVGAYHHYAASMHIYERHFKLARQLADLSNDAFDEGGMPPMINAKAIGELANLEKYFRETGRCPSPTGDRFVDFCITLLSNHMGIQAVA
jgi:thymidylate synthase